MHHRLTALANLSLCPPVSGRMREIERLVAAAAAVSDGRYMCTSTHRVDDRSQALANAAETYTSAQRPTDINIIHSSV